MSIDTFNLYQPQNTQYFFSENITTGSNWKVWNKPTNANFIYFFVLGGGGSGGCAKQFANITNCTGGGGGGSSSITTALYPASLLPDRLYISVGKGGTAGNGWYGAGSPGSLSYVSYDVDDSLSVYNILLQSGAVAAQGGSVGTTNPSTGGAGGTVWVDTAGVNTGLGIIKTIAGQNGGNSASTASNAPAIVPSLPVSGGGGGGSFGAAITNIFSGAQITGSGFFPTVPAGVNSATDSTLNGNPGHNWIYNTMFFTGGSGGAPTAAATANAFGGNGGDGGLGSGGGGGGAAFNSTTSGGSGGLGGYGGAGLVLVAWV